MGGLEDSRSAYSEADMAVKRGGEESVESGGDQASQDTLAEDAGPRKQSEVEEPSIDGAEGVY